MRHDEVVAGEFEGGEEAWCGTGVDGPVEGAIWAAGFDADDSGC